MSVAVLIMVKNEEGIIRTTLDSVKDFEEVVVFDTGSTDGTISILETYPNVVYFKGTFQDFSTSRNELLDYAETNSSCRYFLLLDAGDVFRGTLPPLTEKVYLVQQAWETDRITKYYNLRLIQAGNGFRYKGKVHEYIDTFGIAPVRIDTCELYQDRRGTVANSSRDRWARDLILLQKELGNDPENTRTVFYLAQTYSCLGMKKEAYDLYKKRTTMGGFKEEMFHSMLMCGETNEDLWETSLLWFLRAFEVIKRAEPLVCIAKHYNDNHDMFMAWFYLKLACELEYPKDCILFVNSYVYEYERWHLLGIVSYYVGKMKDGRMGCLKAIEAGHHQIDKDNLAFYGTV